ncbi:MAG TPA: FAD-dependent oxidoreductase, partial [Xanthomonadales bacterium]|nr:FAD-dependent oxidoreductase [Xanthomonadales bacterium]
CSGPGSIARPRIADDRVIRVIVGLRPYRPSGFVVRREDVGARPVVHHYGHGGAGITLSWGTAQQAVELGFDGSGRDYAVVGCGVVGLTTARLLQRRGGRVTIHARELPPNTTSNVAGGHWWPFSVYDAQSASEPFLAQFHAAVRLSYREFQNLVGPRYGVSWRRNYGLSAAEHPISAFTAALRDVAPELGNLPPGEHPFGPRWVQQFDTMMIEPSLYLPALMDDFLAAGGRIEVRELATLREIASLPATAVFNCTGLGARDIVGDAELVPARGQLVVLLPQPELNYNLYGNGAYLFPRHDGLVIGGTFQRGDWNLQPDPADTQQILQNARAAMDWAAHCETQ